MGNLFYLLGLALAFASVVMIRYSLYRGKKLLRSRYPEKWRELAEDPQQSQTARLRAINDFLTKKEMRDVQDVRFDRLQRAMSVFSAGMGVAIVLLVIGALRDFLA